MAGKSTGRPSKYVASTRDRASSIARIGRGDPEVRGGRRRPAAPARQRPALAPDPCRSCRS
jgi:hypothetical protein